MKLGYAVGGCHALLGPHQNELVYPVHHVVPETTSQNHVSELCNATMIPQMTVAVDLTRSEDQLSLKLGHAVGECHALSRPHQDELAYQVHYMVAVTTSRNQGWELSNALMIPLITLVAYPTRSGD